MVFLIFTGLLVATALLILNTLDNLTDILEPAPVRVRNGR